MISSGGNGLEPRLRVYNTFNGCVLEGENLHGLFSCAQQTGPAQRPVSSHDRVHSGMKFDPALRSRFDQVFMELLASVRVEVLDAKPPAMAASSQVAMMFFKESQKSVLQNLAELTASWNSSEINFEVVDRAASTLADMGLEAAQKRLLGLKELQIEAEA
jgi:hypothetical protein